MAQTIFSLTNHEVFLVSSSHAGQRGGFIATWVLPASLLPGTPRILVEISPINHTWQLIKNSGRFAIQLLSAQQSELLIKFGLESGRDCDKFDGIDHKHWEDIPIVEGTCGFCICNTWDYWDIGERIVCVGDTIHHEVSEHLEPLTKAAGLANLPPEQRNLLLSKHTQLAEQSRPLFRSKPE